MSVLCTTVSGISWGFYFQNGGQYFKITTTFLDEKSKQHFEKSYEEKKIFFATSVLS